MSVAISVRDEAARLPWAVRSVLAQTLPAWELLLADDGSTDGTLEAAAPWTADPRIRCVRHTASAGKAARLRELLPACRGRYLLELDADDWLAPQALAVLVSAMERCPGAGMAGGRFHVWFEPKRGELQYRGEQQAVFRASADSASPLIPRMYRTALLRECGGWPVLPAHWDRLFEDIAVCSRILSRFPAAAVVQAVYHRRVHADSISQMNHTQYREWFRVWKGQGTGE
ncbi:MULTISPECIES: glycosyltransferase family 2 protein [Paenibacillus]|uniref:glycosyltransferase family 2 protein n=1 Tax=Paenibacillus TaxID=44249 RepID=UPI0022B8E91C|nr:glycosyltransferase family A protein [Paenibacillus caseinilyticus]MCZ8520825.1 glycosyltransferase family A protein [Paenibacillus caseinilyticus]